MNIGVNKDEAQFIYDSIIYALKMGMRTYVDICYPKAEIPQLLTQLELAIQIED
jgi:hypothetical protein